jgi:hypothetical protein
MPDILKEPFKEVINKKQNLDTMWDCAEDSEELINT